MKVGKAKANNSSKRLVGPFCCFGCRMFFSGCQLLPRQKRRRSAQRLQRADWQPKRTKADRRRQTRRNADEYGSRLPTTTSASSKNSTRNIRSSPPTINAAAQSTLIIKSSTRPAPRPTMRTSSASTPDRLTPYLRMACWIPTLARADRESKKNSLTRMDTGPRCTTKSSSWAITPTK